MKRNIILYHDNLPTEQDNFSVYIDIRQIDEVINHSVDNLYCDTLENLSETDIPIIISKIQQKIRSSGTIMIKFLDIKKICLDFLQNNLSASKYIEYISQKKSIVNLDLIASNIDHSIFMTTKIEPKEYFISIVFTRK